ncbi:helicase associated domain-containing protein [Streptomyces sp900116325]|uniref:helicase associated domain-containing protein n=1 Tax=Streptomyces sp. 900116325 TaxID=3154295 RepID=UPI0033E1BC23
MLVAGGADLDGIVPGVTHHGNDIGRWLIRQARDWTRLNPEQQHRLGELGVKPATRPRKEPAARTNEKAGAAMGSDAFTRGVTALQQYIQREKKTVVGRQHIDELPDGTPVRLGVFLSNQKTDATTSPTNNSRSSPTSGWPGPRSGAGQAVVIDFTVRSARSPGIWAAGVGQAARVRAFPR